MAVLVVTKETRNRINQLRVELDLRNQQSIVGKMLEVFEEKMGESSSPKI